MGDKFRHGKVILHIICKPRYAVFRITTTEVGPLSVYEDHREPLLANRIELALSVRNKRLVDAELAGLQLEQGLKLFVAGNEERGRLRQADGVRGMLRLHCGGAAPLERIGRLEDRR